MSDLRKAVSQKDNLETVKLLIENAADPFVRDRIGTLLPRVVKAEKNISVVKFLVESGGDINQRN